MEKEKRKGRKILSFLLILIVGGVLGYLLRGNMKENTSINPQKEATHETHGEMKKDDMDMSGMTMDEEEKKEEKKEKKILYWVDPMHPWYKADKPGIAPDCGMQLVPVYAEEGEREGAVPQG